MLEKGMIMFDVDNGNCPYTFVADSRIVSHVVLELQILIVRSNLWLRFCDFVVT